MAKAVTFTGSIKWLDTTPFDAGDLTVLVRASAHVPGANPDTPTVAVSRSGVTASPTVSLGPDHLMEAWSGSRAD